MRHVCHENWKQELIKGLGLGITLIILALQSMGHLEVRKRDQAPRNPAGARIIFPDSE